jgi:hypothetical protein
LGLPGGLKLRLKPNLTKLEFFRVLPSKPISPIYPNTLGQFDTNYIIFRNVENFKNYFFQNQKNTLKDNSEYLGIFHLG